MILAFSQGSIWANVEHVAVQQHPAAQALLKCAQTQAQRFRQAEGPAAL